MVICRSSHPLRVVNHQRSRMAMDMPTPLIDGEIVLPNPYISSWPPPRQFWKRLKAPGTFGQHQILRGSGGITVQIPPNLLNGRPPMYEHITSVDSSLRRYTM